MKYTTQYGTDMDLPIMPSGMLDRSTLSAGSSKGIEERGFPTGNAAKTAKIKCSVLLCLKSTHTFNYS